MRTFVLSAVLLALLWSPACAEKADAGKITAERKQVFLDDVPSFIMTLRYWGPEDKPFYWLTLCRQMRPTTAVYQFGLTGVMDKETTVKVIEWLADSGVLAKAEELGIEEKARRAPTGPCYTANINCGKVSLLYNFGWGPEFAKKMTALRALLKNDADEKTGPSPAKQMDIFLSRLSGYWKEWTGKPYEPKAPSDAEGPPKDVALEQTKDGNFVLYVSNQSLALRVVDIKVTIDGQTAVDQSFDVGTQHSWKEFVFKLSKGRHEIKAESAKGEAVLTRTFEVKDKHWGLIDYWYDPKATVGPDAGKKRFTFDIRQEPIMFD